MNYHIILTLKYSLCILTVVVTFWLIFYNTTLSNISKLPPRLLETNQDQEKALWNLTDDFFKYQPSSEAPITSKAIYAQHRHVAISNQLQQFKPSEDFNCTSPGLNSNDLPFYDCKPHIISEEACKFVKRIYKRNYQHKNCGFSRKVEICKYKEVNNHFKYKCSINSCSLYDKSHIRIQTFQSKTMKLLDKGVYNDSSELTSAVEDVAKNAINDDYNFLFLECINPGENIKRYAIPTQFLVLPLKFLLKQKEKLTKKERKITQKKININILLLDSVARAHFFRSLPKTVHAMNLINRETSDEVLDFELFQSVHGHTEQNLRALFAGTPSLGKGNDGVNVGHLYKLFSKQDYSTVYHDDLCYHGWWGVRMDLGSPGSWEKFLEKKIKNSIDSSGLIFANCHIFRANNVSDPFNGPHGPWCFNGKFHDEYYLDYSYMVHKYAADNALNLITFTGLNMGHDDTGRRIQGIDDVMSNYINRIRNATNTLTILFSDHGNTYTHFTHAIMEGRFEQYHPAIFLIIPKNVKALLGDDIMNNLRENQRKLLTLIDLHNALKTVATKVQPLGFFGPVANNRTCNDLPLTLPNLCVCEGWDAATMNNTRQVPFLDFAVGQLNNRIMKSRNSSVERKGIQPKCHYLMPSRFFNVRERNDKGNLITSLTFQVPSGKGSSNSHEVFQVEIQSTVDPHKYTRDMKLINFDRISMYGPYRQCVDEGVDVRLCVCDIINKNDVIHKSSKSSILSIFSTHHNLFHSNTTIMYFPQHGGCLYYKTVNYPEERGKPKNVLSCSFYVANNCKKSFQVNIRLEISNMKTSNKTPLSANVSANTIIYLGGILRDVPYWDSAVNKLKFNCLNC